MLFLRCFDTSQNDIQLNDKKKKIGKAARSKSFHSPTALKSPPQTPYITTAIEWNNNVRRPAK